MRASCGGCRTAGVGHRGEHIEVHSLAAQQELHALLRAPARCEVQGRVVVLCAITGGNDHTTSWHQRHTWSCSTLVRAPHIACPVQPLVTADPPVDPHCSARPCECVAGGGGITALTVNSFRPTLHTSAPSATSFFTILSCAGVPPITAQCSAVSPNCAAVGGSAEWHQRGWTT